MYQDSTIKPIPLKDITKQRKPGYQGDYNSIGKSLSDQNLKIYNKLQNMAPGIAKDMEMPKAMGLPHARTNFKK